MKKNFTRFLAALALLVCMTSSMVVMAMDDGYIVGTTALTSVSNGDLVVWGTSNSNLAKSCSSNWIYLSSVPSEWIVFTVETTDGGFYLKTPDNQYVYSSAAKKVEFSSTNQTVLTINSTNNYVNGGSSIGNYTYNSTGIRPYSGTNYTAAYLYAVTEIPSGTTYTVTYDANGGTGSMTDSNSPYNAGATVTVLDNEFTRTGYTFDHWNTAADDSGTDYDEGDEFTINANTTLYAQWTDNSGSSTVTATLTQSNLGLTGSYTTGTEKTIDGITYVYTDLMKNNDNIQAKASTGTIKNSTAYPGDITSVAITHSGTARATTINGSADGTNWTQVATGSGSLEADFSGLGYKYFQITRGSNAAYWTKIEIAYSNDVTPTCATPTFNPAAGTYDQTQSVSIACTTEGATIYYTLDGNDPTTGSNVYNEALSIIETTTVKAMAVKEGYNNSAVATATYTIVPPAVATPTFSPEAGVYTEAQSVTISCETDGATIQYKLTENGEWQDYTEALAINETTTVWAKATKEGMTDSEIATATYTIVLPLSTMQAIFDRATEVGNTATSVIIALQNWVVSGVSTNGKNVFVTDGTKGFVIFNSGADMGFAVGDILSGTVSCKVQLYNGFAELTQLNSSTEGISITAGGTVTIAEIAMAELAGVNTGALVHYDNLTCSVENNKYYLSDGTTTLQVYNALYAFDALEDGKIYDITGVYQQYNNTKEVLPRSADDIEEVVSAYITVNPDEINVDGVSQDGYLTIDYDNLDIQGAGDFTIQFYDNNNQEIDQPEWMLEANVTAQVGEEGYFVYYMVGTNEDQIRTAYFKVKVSDIYSNLVTITQTKVVPFINLLAVNDGDDPYVINYTHEISGGYPDKIQHGYFSATSGANSFHIQYYDNEGQPIDAGPDWIEQVTVVDAPSWIPSTYALYVSVFENVGPARTAYFKVWALDNDNNPVYSELVTLNQAAYIVDYATLPFEWEGGSSADFAALNGTTLSGNGNDYASSNAPYLIKLDSDGDYIMVKTDSQPGIVTIGVKMIGGTNTSTITVQGSADGETFTDVEILTISGTSTTAELTLETTNAFGNNDRYVKLLFTKGSNVGVGPITIAKYVEPVLVPSITVNPALVEVNAEEHDGTLNLTYENLTITGMGDFDIQYYNATGEELNGDDKPDWIEVLVAEQDPQVGEGYVVSYYMLENEGDARTAYFKVFALGDEDYVYSNLVTVTQAANVVTYSLTTEIVSGKHYIITSGTDGSVKAMGSQSANNRSAVSVTVTDGVIPETEGVYEVVIIGPDVEGYYTLYDVTNEKYLYAAGTGSSNHLKSQNDIDDRARWTITFNDDAAVINSITTETNRTLMRYNSGSNCFSCYGSGQQPIYLFAKDNEPTVSYEKEIASYGNSLNGGYYLIASPVGQVTPTESNEFLTNNYDLYAFDQSEEDEWRNYEAGSFNLISGRGYLYANSGENVTLTFEGYPYVGNGQVVLAYDGNAEFAGWNLVGNPFDKNATLSLPYYSLNEEGTALNTFTGESPVEAMEGVFVKATGAGQSVLFTPANTQANSVSQLNLKVTRNRSAVLDNAIIRFDNGAMLDKFQLNPNSTKVYFTEGNHNYAIVRSEAQGEMPVNFKAESNGTYTIAVEPKNVELTYLHLIDNRTGADVDLLANPSYTFEANKGDNANRFRLVFKAGTSIEENASTNSFAYFNGSEWVISNTGDATLQVIDMMGRVLRSEQISGNTTVNINETAGIYMLRLVNGENVMVQKVVVR